MVDFRITYTLYIRCTSVSRSRDSQISPTEELLNCEVAIRVMIKNKNSPTDFVGELGANLLHLSHVLHHRNHLDKLFEITKGKQQFSTNAALPGFGRKSDAIRLWHIHEHS